MNSSEYHQLLSNAKTQAEKDKINDEFLKSKVSSNKSKRIIKFLKDNALAIIALVVAILDFIKDLFIK